MKALSSLRQLLQKLSRRGVPIEAGVFRMSLRHGFKRRIERLRQRAIVAPEQNPVKGSGSSKKGDQRGRFGGHTNRAVGLLDATDQRLKLLAHRLFEPEGQCECVKIEIGILEPALSACVERSGLEFVSQLVAKSMLDASPELGRNVSEVSDVPVILQGVIIQNLPYPTT